MGRRPATVIIACLSSVLMSAPAAFWGWPDQEAPWGAYGLLGPWSPARHHRSMPQKHHCAVMGKKAHDAAFPSRRMHPLPVGLTRCAT
jgi:hypothetical protein